MKAKPDLIVDAKRLIVNCMEYEEVDCVPRYLGYDFYVDPSQEEEMKKFIRQTLAQYDRPLIDILSKDKKVKRSKLWTKSMIDKCIRENKLC